MKRDELKSIEGLSAEQIDAIMNLHQKDVLSWNARNEAQANALAEKETTINGLNEKLKGFDGIDIAKMQKDYADLMNKYTSDMVAKDKAYAKERLFDSIKWSSDLAKNGAKALFDSKNLEFKDGKYEGIDDFINGLKESDPLAFYTGEEKGRTTGFSHTGEADDNEISEVEKEFYKLNPRLK